MTQIWNKHKQLNTTLKPKVFVALSGGVDSSVSAALLKERGFDVRGVFIKIWAPNGDYCSMSEDRMDAIRAAAHLEIPFTTIDLSREYKAEVADYMLCEYAVGRTPNPDVMCNSRIKFGAFFDWAMKGGADYIATGHYARLVRPQGSDFSKLYVGKDENKDQTYFLWTLKQKILTKTIFPVGEYTKPQVRELARKFGLPNSEKKDSQGICFLGQVDMRDYLEDTLDVKAGKVLSTNGAIVGEHSGAALYTIGQRKGFNRRAVSPSSEPVFVVAKNMDENTITVASRSDITKSDLLTKKVRIRDINWTKGFSPELKELECRVRYRQPFQHCNISNITENFVYLNFKEPQYIASGQSIVFYDGEECLGGGVME